jgi:anti-sigma B factor antagonist
MYLQSEEAGDVLVIKMPNIHLDAGNAEDFKKSIANVVEDRKKVALDLSGIGFMDSAGLGAVLSAFKKVRANGGQFKVFGLTGEVRSLFDLVRMQRLLDVYPDKEAAISAFTG